MSADPPTPQIEALLRQREWLRAIARCLVDDENDVDDVEQRTWLAALRSPRQVVASRAWLRRVVRNAVVDEHRSASRRLVRETAAARAEAVPDTARLVAQAEAQRAVAHAVTALAEPYRTTILLRYLDALPPREIASRMGVPVETVRTRLKRAHAQLRADLDRECGDRRAWALALLPLTRTGPSAPPWAVITGALVMGSNAKVVAGVTALVLLFVGGAAWQLSRHPADPAPASAAAAPPVAGAARASRRPAPLSASGRVRSRHDGLPMANARVFAADGEEILATTADDGTFHVDGVASRALRVTAPGFVESHVDLHRGNAGHADLGDVWLDAAATLVVEVVGPLDAPLEGARVELVRRPHHGEVATTNSYLRSLADPDFRVERLGARTSGADGTVRFDASAPALYQIVARRAGHAVSAAQYVPVVPGAGETRSRIRLERGHELTGVLVTARGDAAPGWLVAAEMVGWDESAFVRTDADGRFRLADVGSGDVVLVAGRERSRCARVGVVRVPDVRDVVLRLPPMGTLEGKVTLHDGTPVANAEVGVETTPPRNDRRAGAYAPTDADGRYRIEDLPIGSITRFDVRRAGLHHVDPHVVLGRLIVHRDGEAGTPADVNEGETTVVDVTMARAARLSGRVLSPEGPVAGAWVFLHVDPQRKGQAWETATTDAAGRYDFDFLPPRRVALQPLHPGYAHPATVRELGNALRQGTVADALVVDLSAGGSFERDLHVLPGTRVAGRVLGPGGNPVAGARVDVDTGAYSTPLLATALTDADGTFVLPRVGGRGDAVLRVEAAGLCIAERAGIVLEPGARIDGLTVRMVAQPHCRGRVSDAAGQGVPDARVIVQFPGPTYTRDVTVWTDHAGEYDTPLPLVNAKLTIAASAQDLGDVAAAAEVSGESVRVDLTLPPLRDIAGRVVTATGEGVPGAEVIVRSGPRPPMFTYGDLTPTSWGRPDCTWARSDERGGFSLRLPGGRHFLVVRARGMVDEVRELTLPTTEDVVVRLRPAVTLSGVLRDAAGSPLAFAQLVLDPGRGAGPSPQFAGSSPESHFFNGLGPAGYLLRRNTDARGAFSFPGLPEAEFTLVLVEPGGPQQALSLTRFGPLLPSRGPHALRVGAPTGGSISGRVLLPTPLEFAETKVLVQVMAETGGERDPPPVAVAPDGSFRVDGLTSPRYTLRLDVRFALGAGAYRIGHFRRYRGVTLGARGLVLDAREGPRVRGRLLDDSGAPLAEVTIETDAVADQGRLGPRRSHQGRTDADGRFDFSIDEEEFRLRARGSPNRRIVTGVTLHGGADLGDVVASLDPRIRGRVVDANGDGVAGAKVTVVHERGGRMQVVTADALGAFEATGLEPATRYRIRLEGDLRGTWDDGPFAEAGATDVRLVRDAAR